ncbi:helicase-exonuclease AddAB subunit AddB [Paenibacillus thalictri]|uniref:ATP-dependent helicase/deoxyribonuclease subunit B n=1 Tax=Paenibacillus thalictri TaxID=2527873 RepID=A0A4V6MSC9_9BACL|nr:helicase-exonuclease AddAB subunit AddB [Paenibacillus thalictri]TBL70386.1 helicase-exonuclease AddAB subunit AddB [Paenibacillus thalictri]
MAIRFVIGRAGSGKTRFCLDEIRGKLKAEPAGHPLVMLVPEQATFQAEYELVATPELGGMMRAQALSFRRLAWRVMQETGGTARLPIDDTGKKLLLHKLMLQHQHELKWFHASVDQLGVIDNLNQLFTELKRYCITGERLGEFASGAAGRETAGTLEDKLHDIRLVYGAFETELSKLYLDGEDCLALLARQLPESEFAASAEVWVDGFNGFTPQEFAGLEQLMLHARDVTVTLCLDREYGAGEQPDELALFHPTARTMAKLQEIADRLGVKRRETVYLDSPELARFSRSPMLAHLENSWDKRIRWPFRPEPMRSQVALNGAANRRAEAEAAAREMVRLVRDEGLRWRDLSVRVRNMDEYGGLLSAALTDYGIPHFFDQKRSVLHHPLVELIRSALEVILYNWKYDAVFRCVKTDFFLPLPWEEGAPRITRDDMNRLENAVLAFGIHGSRWTDNEPWRLAWRSALEEDVDPGLNAAEERENQTINECRSRIVRPLLAFQKQMKQAKCVRDQVEALYFLLTGLDAAERLERWSQEALRSGMPEKAKEHAQVWDRVIDMMDQLVELMGEEQVELESFTRLVETGLESIRLGLVPPSLDQVLVGSIDRTRSGAVKQLFILGAGDGVMPARISEDGILSESERDKLAAAGLGLAENSRRKLLDEQFLIYCALCAPSDRLWISYPQADEEGKSLLPSDIIRQLRHLFPGVKETYVPGEPAASMDVREQADFIAHPGRALSYLSVQLKQAVQGTEIADLWWDTYNWFAGRPEWHGRLQRVVSAMAYSNGETSLSPQTSLELYGGTLKASVSRMERFVACPFSQFASHGLRLAERRVYRLEAPDVGQLFHAALSQFADRVMREGIDWGALSAEECRSRASEVVDALAPRLQGEILLSSKRYHYIARKLKATVGRAAAVLGEHAKRGEFVPVGLELGFGPGEPLPPMMFRLDNGGEMEVVGRIDRVDKADTASGTLLRVIDYKSSSTSLGLSEVYYGLSLQMLTYLDVVLTYADRWIGTKAEPAGVLYFHVHNPIVTRKNAPAADEIEKELAKRYKMKGLVLADEEAVLLMDGELAGKSGHSQLIPVAMKTDGSFYKASSVATQQQWTTLRKYVRRTIRRIGSEITSGRVDIAPYRMRKKTACQFCSYRPVCQFDPLLEGNGFASFAPLGKDFAWQLLEREAQKEGEDRE